MPSPILNPISNQKRPRIDGRENDLKLAIERLVQSRPPPPPFVSASIDHQI
jgi:hypothetical protein